MSRKGLSLKASMLVIAGGALLLALIILSARRETSKNISELIQQLKNGDIKVRVNAVKALEKYADRRAVEAVGVLSDKREAENVRGAAATALARYPEAVETLLSSLIALLKDEDVGVRLSAVEELGRLNNSRVVDPLIAAFEDKNDQVQHAAALALGQNNDPRASEFLLDIFHNRQHARWRDAAEALAISKDTRAESALLAALRERDLSVLCAAHGFFIRRGESALYLISALNQCGNPDMAASMLNSGNTQFRDAATAWAASHNYVIFPIPKTR